MQAIAREIGFSETTFVTEAGGDRYAMRIFTPAAELPFAGHPTLGTAFVMVSEGRVKSPATQVLSAGEFVVDVDLDGGFVRMEQLLPRFGPDEPGAHEVVSYPSGWTPRTRTGTFLCRSCPLGSPISSFRRPTR